MSSSIGQIVGLIEIEPRSEPVGLADLGPADADAASLVELFSQLAGRLSARSNLRGAELPAAATGPANRLAPPAHDRALDCPALLLRIDADLARLAADLDDETQRVRLHLVEALADESAC